MFLEPVAIPATKTPPVMYTRLCGQLSHRIAGDPGRE